MASTSHHGGAPHVEEHAHPDPRQYIRIAVVLAIITALEVAIFYIKALEDYDTYILLPLSALKFILVVGYYMHLKFDNKLFTYTFIFGLSVGGGVILSLMALFDRMF
ncbi:MAG TPA: cytochrome C oxidase subunit IV family protein [Thermomicrobiales bacterium]|nr:cytochrome C oxidase subunit IV family protein [Thermomicrobiales bacterium]